MTYLIIRPEAGKELRKIGRKKVTELRKVNLRGVLIKHLPIFVKKAVSNKKNSTTSQVTGKKGGGKRCKNDTEM